MEDALLLQQHLRTARATALTILAFEEYGKALMLLILVREQRWDEMARQALFSHEKKQTFAGAVEGLVRQQLAAHHDQLLHSPSLRNPASALPAPTTEEVDTSMQSAEEQQLDGLKQACFYVSVAINGIQDASPIDITAADFDTCRARVVELKELLDACFQVTQEQHLAMKAHYPSDFEGKVTV